MLVINPIRNDLAFKQPSFAQMVRALLLERANPKYAEDRNKYVEVLRKAIGDNSLLSRVMGLMKKESLTRNQKRLLRWLAVEIVSYTTNKLNHNELREKGILEEHKGGLDELVRALDTERLGKIISVPAELFPEPAGIQLNGYDVIAEFAKKCKIELPESYKERKVLTDDVRQLLRERCFTFRKAVAAAFRVQEKKGIMAYFYVVSSTGRETRFTNIDWVKAYELFSYIRQYWTKDSTKVPKRMPYQKEGMLYQYNRPHIEVDDNDPVGWMELSARCDCSYANYKRQKRTISGSTIMTEVFDAHLGTLMLQKEEEEEGSGLNAAANEFNLSLVPSNGLIRLVDNARYRCAVENNNKTSPLSEKKIEVLINAFGVMNKFDMLYPTNAKGSYAIGPLIPSIGQNL